MGRLKIASVRVLRDLKEWAVKIAELGYLLVGAPDSAEWTHFAENVVGAMTVGGPTARST